MLVLSRRIGERIVIANEIHVTVLAINGRRVRLGIAAPRSVHVARLELLSNCTDAAAPTKAGEPETMHKELGRANEGIRRTIAAAPPSV